jgi:integrase
VTATARVLPLFGPRPPADGGLLPEVLEGWTAWLTERIDPAWRPGEWDPAALLFTGDVDNPATVVYRCGTAACQGLARSRGLCTTCERAFKTSSLTIKQFKAEFVPERNRVIAGVLATCRVTLCPREAILWGLCSSHGSLRQKELARHPESDLQEWVARQRPYEPAPPCTVARCRYDARMTYGLCSMHTRHWKARLDAIGAASETRVDPRWLERQTPYLNVHQFSLAPLEPVARLEMLYALQQRDARGQKIDPLAVRQAVKHLAPLVESIGAAGADRLPHRSQANVDALVRETHRVVAGAFDRFRGVDPAEREKLDLTEFGVRALRGGKTSRPGDVDVSAIRQPWLRALLVSWIAETAPTTAEVRRGLRAVRAAAAALDTQVGGGLDPAALTFANMNTVVDMFRNLRTLQDGPMKAKARSGLLSFFFKILDYGRAAGHLDGMSASFARHSSHTIKREDENEEEIGKALPESVIAQLDEHEDLLGAGITHGRMQSDQVAAMARAVYGLLRDTGRRPSEIGALHVKCLERRGGDWFLIWDNTKARRNRRRLPIDSETVAIVQEWLQVRETLDLPSGSEQFLFPPAGESGVVRHLRSEQIWAIIRSFADRIPVLLAEEFGRDGQREAFDRSMIFPYAFRHSYAQRHADAGTPIDVLRDLMDHASTATTQGYYTVSLKRKREAVDVLRRHTLDKAGRAAPMSSATAYERRMVAVPFGGCTEPANVKAGGNACPLRFQCAACKFYRPDPSFLPAVEDHIRSLRRDKEKAVMMEADEFVIRNLEEQIEAFKKVVAIMHKQVEEMDEEEREAVMAASAVLRKVRAGQSKAALGMPSFPPRRGEAAG